MFPSLLFRRSSLSLFSLLAIHPKWLRRLKPAFSFRSNSEVIPYLLLLITLTVTQFSSLSLSLPFQFHLGFPFLDSYSSQIFTRILWMDSPLAWSTIATSSNGKSPSLALPILFSELLLLFHSFISSIKGNGMERSKLNESLLLVILFLHVLLLFILNLNSDYFTLPLSNDDNSIFSLIIFLFKSMEWSIQVKLH